MGTGTFGGIAIMPVGNLIDLYAGICGVSLSVCGDFVNAVAYGADLWRAEWNSGRRGRISDDTV